MTDTFESIDVEQFEGKDRVQRIAAFDDGINSDVTISHDHKTGWTWIVCQSKHPLDYNQPLALDEHMTRRLIAALYASLAVS
jgi:hypothetical protein